MVRACRDVRAVFRSLRSIAALGLEQWAPRHGHGVVLDRQSSIETGSASGHCHSLWGTAIVALTPYRPLEARDSAEISVWAASSAGALQKVGWDGSLLRRVELGSTAGIKAIAWLGREVDPPTIAIISPIPGAVVGPRPQLELEMSDAGTGIDTSSLAFTSEPSASALPVSCSFGAGGAASCQPVVDMSEGAATVSATVRDLAGNVSTPAQVAISVDSAPPTIEFTAPPNGSEQVATRPPLSLAFADAGSGVDESTLSFTANGAPLIVDCARVDGGAVCTPVGPLPPGDVEIGASVRDGAGLQATTTLALRINPAGDTSPPTLTVLLPRAGYRTTDNTPALRFSASDSGSGVDPLSLVVTSEGRSVPVSCPVGLVQGVIDCVPTSALGLGVAHLAVTVADGAGNRSPEVYVDVTIDPAWLTVTGRVTLEDGTPFPGAQVYAAERSGVANAGPDGSFSLSAVDLRVPGPVQIVAVASNPSGGLWGSNPVNPPAGATADVGTIVMHALCPGRFSPVFGMLHGFDDAPTDQVAAMTVFDDGTGPALVAGGAITSYRGAPLHGVARWDGRGWDAIGAGFDGGMVFSLAVFDDGGGPALYAGGSFTGTGGSPLPFLARWTGSTWVPVGNGVDGVVYSMTVWDDGTGAALYVAGDFSSAGGVPAKSIARWDGAQWAPLGAGLDDGPMVLTVHDDGAGLALFAGGMFDQAGDRSVSGLARWDGEGWSDPTGGVNGSVLALASWRGKLYVGGSFSIAGGSLAANGLASWDGSRWSSLGLPQTDFGGVVYALSPYDDGEGESLFIGGRFATPTSPRGRNIARTDGLSLFTAGNEDDPSIGFYDAIYDLAVVADVQEAPRFLAMGGKFAALDGIESRRLGKFERSCDWTPPSLSITSPAESATITASASAFVAGSTDPQSELFVNGAPTPIDAGGAFGATIALPAGASTWNIEAFDSAGNSTLATRQIYRDSQAPSIRWISPQASSTVTTTRPTLELEVTDDSAADFASLSFSRAGLPVSVSCEGGAVVVSCHPATDLPQGGSTIVAHVRDLAGNWSTDAARTITVAGSSSGYIHTTLVGVVTLGGGAPAAGALVSVLGARSASVVTGADGSFRVEVELPTSAAVAAVARLTTSSGSVAGLSAATDPAANGVTNVGAIVLKPLCAMRFDESFRSGVGVDGLYPWEYADGTDTYFTPRVNAMAVYDDGRGAALYVAGRFFSVAGVPANNIARWDGTSWSSLGSAALGGGVTGVEAVIRALAVYKGELYAGGTFTSANGVSVSTVAKWNGTTWISLGNFTSYWGDPKVNAMVVFGTDLYVAGRFGGIGALGAVNVAKWNGSAWSALGASGLGSTVTDEVFALATYGSTPALYAGGTFLASGTTTLNHLAKWTGSKWTAVGGGLGPATSAMGVSALASFNGSLYVGGLFNSAGPTSVNGIAGVARWDGRNWYNASSGLYIWQDLFTLGEQGIQDFAAYDDGTGPALFAVGAFKVVTASGTVDANIAKLAGSTWQPVGGGSRTAVEWGGAALLPWDVPGDDRGTLLFVGNDADAAGVPRVPVNGLGVWDGARWSGIGSGPATPVRAAASFGGDLYAFAGGEQGVVRWDGSAWAGLPPISGGIVRMQELTWDGESSLFAWGSLSKAGPWPAAGLARWTGTQWLPGPTPPAATEIRALIRYDDGGGPALYVVSRRASASSESLYRLRAGVWTLLAEKDDGWGIYSLVGFDDGSGPALYLATGGTLDGLGPSAVYRLRLGRFETVGTIGGDGWAAYDLEVFRDRLVAGGNLGTPATSVAMYGATGWQALGSAPSSVSDLAVFDDGGGAALFAIGPFEGTANHLMKWNGTSWAAVSPNDFITPYSYPDNYVDGLVGFDDGRGEGPALYAFGWFGRKITTTQPAGWPSKSYAPNYIARLYSPLDCSASDTGKPTLSFASPVNGSYVSSTMPGLDVSYNDALSGIDTSTLSIKRGGVSVPVTCSYGAFTAHCVPQQALPTGSVTLTATIRDLAGNTSLTAQTSFTVRLGPPTLTFVVPVQNQLFLTATPTIELDYSPDAVLASLNLSLSSSAVAFQCSAVSTTKARCVPASALPDGKGTYTATVANAAGERCAPVSVQAYVDTLPPTLAFTSPSEGAAVGAARPPIRMTYADAGTQADPSTLVLQLDGTALVSTCTLEPDAKVCTPTSALTPGPHVLTATIRDLADRVSAVATVHFSYAPDTAPPVITLSSPVDPYTAGSLVEVRGSLDEMATLTLNGTTVPVENDLTFDTTAELASGANAFELVATDVAGNVARRTFTVTQDRVAPVLAFLDPQSGAVLTSPSPLRFSYVETGSGIDAAAAELRMGTQVLPATCDAADGVLSCVVTGLPEGSSQLTLVVRDHVGNSFTLSGPLTIDTQPPQIQFTSPVGGAILDTLVPTLGLSFSDSGVGVDPGTLEIRSGDAPLQVTCSPSGAGATCKPVSALPNGAVAILTATIADSAGHRSAPATVQFTVDTTYDGTPPAIVLLEPLGILSTRLETISVRGRLSEPASLTLSGAPVAVASDLGFVVADVPLVEGENLLALQAVDAAGNVGNSVITVRRDTQAPAGLDRSKIEVETVRPGTVALVGAAGSIIDAEAGLEIIANNLGAAHEVAAPAGADGSFRVEVAALPGERIALMVGDAAANRSPAEIFDVSGSLPTVPDPASVASPLNPSLPPSFCDRYAFLYESATPVQFGVAAGAVECRHAALVSGRALNPDGTPLTGVAVRVREHADLGFTVTRSDGKFDLVIPGGARVTLEFVASGRLPVLRTANLEWNEVALVDDVVMTPIDSTSTVVAFGAGAQSAAGSLSSDSAGQRRAAAFFPAGVAASAKLANGELTALTTGTLRFTEYSVGPRGPRAVPAPLPSTVAYTYAVEATVDEASALGAAGVEFDRPVFLYVDDFIGFPVGSSVPSGSLDRATGLWVPSPDGFVLQIVSTTGGTATVDVTGGGPADAATLSALGFTAEELSYLAGAYPAGRKLWRVPVTHFSSYTFDWPFGAPNDLQDVTPKAPLPSAGETKLDHPSYAYAGGAVEVENQTLAQSLGIVGTPFSLNYRSDRMPGRRVPYELTIPLSGPALQPDVTRMEVSVEVGGVVVGRSADAQPGITYHLEWDGVDAHGRPVQGGTSVTADIRYFYGGMRYCSSPIFSSAEGGGWKALSFALLGSVSCTDKPLRSEYMVSRKSSEVLGSINIREALGFGGWSFSAQHFFDPNGLVLYYGTGGRRTLREPNQPQSLTRVAGTGAATPPAGSDGDGGPAVRAYLARPAGLTALLDGSLLIADRAACRIWKVDTLGVIHNLAGRACGPSDGDVGDGGPATEARLSSPEKAVVGPDGLVYIADVHRVRRIEKDGTIRTVVGNGLPYAGSDPAGGPATAAQISAVQDIAFAPDGSMYLTHGDVVSRVVGGTFHVVNPQVGPLVPPSHNYFDGQPVVNTSMIETQGLAIDSDGSVYVSMRNAVRRIGSDGTTNLVAGWPYFLVHAGFGGDGELGDKASFFVPQDIARDRSGNTYVADEFNHRIRRIRADGIVDTVTGGGGVVPGEDGLPARAGALFWPEGVATSPDGRTLYIADTGRGVVWKMDLSLEGDEFTIPSEDGSERYVFSRQGLHLRTLNGLTGATMLTFRYGSFTGADGNSRPLLTAVEDAFGNLTHIERGADGNVSAIVAPFGQRTELTLDGGGYLQSLSRSSGNGAETVQLGYQAQRTPGGSPPELGAASTTAEGLLASLTTPKQQHYTYTYDADGRLVRAEDPDRGTFDLHRQETEDGHFVESTTAEGRTSRHEVEITKTGTVVLTQTDSAGIRSRSEMTLDGKLKTVAPYVDDASANVSTTIEVARQPDPRFGAKLLYATTVTVTSPNDPALQGQPHRSVTTRSRAKDQGAYALLDTSDTDGRISTWTYSAASHEIAEQSPEGRVATTVIDDQGRTTERRVPGVLPVHYAYDGHGRLQQVSQGPTGAARTVTYGYDAGGGWLDSVTDPENRETRYEHDEVGRVTKVILPDPAHHELSFDYDLEGNTTSITPPGRPAHTFDYTPVDQLLAYTPPDVDPNDQVVPKTGYDYNADHQVTTITRPDLQAISVHYDAAGRIDSVTLPTGAIDSTWDPVQGTLQSLSAPDGETLTYETVGSLPTRETWSGEVSGSVELAYDPTMRLRERRVNGNSTSFAWSDDGQLTEVGIGAASGSTAAGCAAGQADGCLRLGYRADNGALEATELLQTADVRTYDSNFGQLARYAAGVRTSGSQPACNGTVCGEVADAGRLLEDVYEYDALGRIREKTETTRSAVDAPPVTKVYGYTYDDLGRLTDVRTDGVVTEHYGYDANGNRTSWSYGGSSGGSATYDDQDRLLTYGSTSYTYTANGELRTKSEGGQTVTYDYDVRGSLLGVTLADGLRIDYVVDGAGRRIGKKVAGTLVRQWLYKDGLAPVAELDGSGNLVTLLVYGSGGNVPDAMVRGGTTYRFVRDHLGSVRVVVDAESGAVAQRLEYDSFGRVVLDTSPGWQPFGFAGGLYEYQTGLVRFGARDYDAEVGRWTSKDPIGFAGGDSGLYDYAGNDPVNFSDPSGLIENVQQPGFTKSLAEADWSDAPWFIGAAMYLDGGLAALAAAPTAIGWGYAAYSWCRYLNPAACTSLVVGALEPPGGGTSQLSSFSAVAPGPLPGDIAETFAGGRYVMRTLESEITVYRVYGGSAGLAGRRGTFYSPIAQQGGLQSMIDLALRPEWGNSASAVSPVTLKAGTVIFEGIASSQGGPWVGGTPQIFVP